MESVMRKTDETGVAVPMQTGFRHRVSNRIDQFFRLVVGITVFSELTLMFTNMAVRWLTGKSFQGIDEMGEMALIIIAFIGGAVAYPRGDHVAVEILYKLLPSRWHKSVEAFSTWVLIGISVAWAAVSIKVLFTTTIMNQTSIMRISEGWYTLPMIIGFLLFAYYGLQKLASFTKKIGWISGLCVLVIAILGFLSYPAWSASLPSQSALTLTLAAVVILLLIGVPIGFVLAAGAMMYVSVTPTVHTTAASITMQNSMMDFVLLAIPFFIMTGLVMTGGGLSRRLIHFIMALVGRVRGGLYHVIIVGTYIMSGLSGSKVADVTAVGTTINDTLEKEGYDPGESAAVLASAAVMGETVPPCMNMLVLGSISSLSIGTLFVAGIVPAVVMAIVLMVLIAIRARAVGLPISAKVSVSDIFKRAAIAIPALITPVLLIGGITTGVGTPTEVSTSAVVYSILLGFFIYRELSSRALWDMAVETASKAGMVLFIVGGASAFSWSLTFAQVPHHIATFLISLAGNSPIAFMALSIFVLIIMGAVLEGLPAILIFTPLLMPIAPQFGINPIQFGLVLILSMGLGNFLPPIGVGSYICIAVTKTKLENMMRHMFPYIIALLVGIFIIALVPWFTMLLPKMFGLM